MPEPAEIIAVLVARAYGGDAQALAELLDVILNIDRGPDPEERQMFLLLWGEFRGEKTNYISNAERDGARVLLRELLARWEGQPEMEGRA